MSETNITFTPEFIAANPGMFTAGICSGSGASTSIGMTVNATASTVEYVAASPDVAIRHIVAEEIAKSEERIAEMAIRKLKLQAGTRG